MSKRKTLKLGRYSPGSRSLETRDALQSIADFGVLKNETRAASNQDLQSVPGLPVSSALRAMNRGEICPKCK